MGKTSKLVFCAIFLWLGSGATSIACPLDTNNHLDPIGIRSIFDPIPSSGDQKLLVILVDFSDEPGRYTQTSFTGLYFSESQNSFGEYFREISLNKLNYTGDVVGVSGGSAVVGGTTVSYVRLPNPKSYYANGNAGRSSEFPKNLVGIYYHAITTLEGVGFDFSPYADNGELKNVIVVFAGRSSVESGSSSDIQPTSYSLDAYISGGYVSNGLTFKNFTICPEMDGSSQSGFGVCAHEHGHSLGMPDLYDGSYVSFGIGKFDLMSYGTFGGSYGARPFHLGAFSKIKLGWRESVDNYGTPAIVTLDPVQTSGAIYKIAKNASSREYFLVENRQAVGFDDDLDEASLCPGILIWHIDEDVYDNNRLANKVNYHSSAGGPNHFGVALVEQDGQNDMRQAGGNIGECDDTFTVGTSWGKDSSAAHSKLWDGSETGFTLEVLEVSSTGAVTVALNGAEASVDSVTAKVRRRSVSGSISKLGSKSGYTVSLVRIKDNKIIKSKLTGDSGKFAFKKVRPGRYIVRCEDRSSAPLKVRR